jgi:hypothetical protein
MKRLLVVLTVLLVAGCAPLSPVARGPAAADPDPRAVIYVLRAHPDASDRPAVVWLDDRAMGATVPGTAFRWTVEPGRHRIAGHGPDGGRLEIDAAPGGVYFVQQTFQRPLGFSGSSRFQLIDEDRGRDLLRAGRLAG